LFDIIVYFTLESDRTNFTGTLLRNQEGVLFWTTLHIAKRTKIQ